MCAVYLSLKTKRLNLGSSLLVYLFAIIVRIFTKEKENLTYEFIWSPRSQSFSGKMVPYS
jgi:hypothetical protein